MKKKGSTIYAMIIALNAKVKETMMIINAKNAKSTIHFMKKILNKNCYDNATKNNIGQYYNEEKNKYYQCYSTCYYCLSKGDIDDHLCTKCISDYFFYESKGDNNCFNSKIPNTNEGYYLPPLSDKFYQCYQTCAHCKIRGNIIDHNCVKCKSPLEPNPDTKTNCMKNCPSYWIRTEDYYYVCIDQCNSDYSYLIPEYNQCISECTSEFPFIFGKKCVKNCPTDTTEVNKTCLSSCYPTVISQAQIVPFINHNLDDCIHYFSEYILFYKELHKHIAGIGFSFEVYSLSLPLQKFDNISQIDFSQCEILLKEYDQSILDIIIAKFVLIRDGLPTNQIEYSVYNQKGDQLDLTQCTDQSIIFHLAIKDVNDTYKLITSYSDFFSDNFDLFNQNDPFYNDYCFAYPINGFYLPIEDRRRLYFHNISFCEVSCTYDCINNKTNEATCICFTKTDVMTTNIIPNKVLFFPQEIPWSNILIGACYNLFVYFDNSILSSLFWLYGFLFLTVIVLSLLYYFKGLIKLLSIVEKQSRIDYSIFYKIKNEYMIHCISNQNRDLFFNEHSLEFSINNPKSLEKKRKIETKSLKYKIKSNEFADLPYKFALIMDNRSMWRMFYRNNLYQNIINHIIILHYIFSKRIVISR